MTHNARESELTAKDRSIRQLRHDLQKQIQHNAELQTRNAELERRMAEVFRISVGVARSSNE